MAEFIYWMGGLFAAAVFVYLLVALLVPERF